MVSLKAYAKINFSLDVISKRDDGYHELKTIMQTVDLHDDISIEESDGQGITIKCDKQFIPTDKKNIVYRITEYILQKYNIKKSININIKKNIPVGAGLGGGSSDGAAVLLGLNKMFDLSIKNEELMQIGKSFGADIPYCILGGTALAEGIGEKLTPLSNLPETIILICQPKVRISTSYVFGKFEFSKTYDRPDTGLLLTAIENSDIKTLACNMKNVLETVTTKEYPVINQIKEELIKNGALGAMMSGSGTAVFGIFDNYKKAQKASKELKKFSNEIFITKTFNKTTKN
jgi:4-diphosphocytidyl-2-C-methyl-D-erythritol kinase